MSKFTSIKVLSQRYGVDVRTLKKKIYPEVILEPYARNFTPAEVEKIHKKLGEPK